MNKHIATVLAVSAFLAIRTTPAAAPSGKASGTGAPQNPVLAESKRYESFERTLASVRTLPDNATAAAQAARSLLQISKSSPPSLGGIVLEAACAGLIAGGADSTYASARKALGDPKAFEDRVLDRCSACGATGRQNERCSDCFGTGKCRSVGCRNGQKGVPQVGGGTWWVACPSCSGTGQCKSCNGAGTVTIRCKSCGGAGRKINRDSAQTLYRERVDAAIKECRRHEVVSVSGIGGTGTTLAKATADALVNAVLKVHGPDGATTQKLLGADDKTIVKYSHVVSSGEDESGLIQVKANVLVAKVLQGSASRGNASGRSPVDDPFNSGDPFAGDPWN